MADNYRGVLRLIKGRQLWGAVIFIYLFKEP